MRSIFLTVIAVLLTVIGPSAQEYIRSEELTLDEDAAINSELVNLNALLTKSGQQSAYNLLFKIVDDTPLVGFLGLKCVNEDACFVILKKKLDYTEICDSLANTTCSLSLKVIALNQNDFIEIPVLVKRRTRKNKILVPLRFDMPRGLTLNITGQSNSFILNAPTIRIIDPNSMAITSKQLSILSQKIEYKLESLTLPESIVRAGLVRMNSGQLRLDFNFTGEQTLNRAVEQNAPFTLKLAPYIRRQFLEEGPILYDLANTTMEITLKFTDLATRQLKPLEFEYPVYSILLDNQLSRGQAIAEPRLKEIARNNQVTFTLLLKDVSDGLVDLPFTLDSDTGRLHLTKSTAEILNSTTDERTYSFGIKATYKQLTEPFRSVSESSSKTNYYYDYIIPAFAKIEVKLRSSNRDLKLFKPVPKVETEFLTPFISKYEILNEDTANQTLVFYINDPIQVKSKLVKFHLRKNDTSDSQLTWVYENEMRRNFIYNVNTGNITLINKNELKDQNNYKTQLKLVEVTGGETKPIVLAELNVEFRVDYDPILFEKNEYALHLNQASLIEQNLLNIKVRERVNKDVARNVAYRIKETEADSEFFEVNPTSGWLRARQTLDTKAYYEIVIVATNSDLQKSGTVRCKVYVDCQTKINVSAQATANSARFSIFDDSSNRTQIGVFKSVCASQQNNMKPGFAYSIDTSEIFIRFCSKQSRAQCKKYNFNRLMSARSSEELVTLDANNGYLTTNCVFNVNSLITRINDDYFHSDEDVFDSNFVSLQLKANMQTQDSTTLNYNIEIGVSNVPKIVNFDQGLVLTEKTDLTDTNSAERPGSNQCLFNYKFMINEDSEHSGVRHRTIAGRNSPPPIRQQLTSVPRFVRIDQNLGGHFGEAEFKTADCSAWFFIYNNGCLAIRNERRDEETARCSLINEKNTQNGVLLKSGAYSINFKLCYYNSNKVSCSPFYNQTILVPRDLHKSMKLVANAQTAASDKILHLDKILDSARQPPASSGITSYGVYLLALFGLVIVVAIVVLVLLAIMFIVPKRSNHSDKAFVLPKSGGSGSNVSANSSDVSKRSMLEVSCETGNRTSTGSSNENSATHTPETSSNAPTTSSKVSKLEDEEHEECVGDEADGVKIQVTDDHFLQNRQKDPVSGLDQSVIEAMKQLQFTSHNNNINNNTDNFNYAGSFSSIGESSGGSSTHSYQRRDNEQGLYSVKNGAIQYNVINATNNLVDGQIQSLSPIEYNINLPPFELTPHHHHYQPDLYFKANLVDVISSPGHSYESSYLEVNGQQANYMGQNQRQQQLNPPKMNSLKQLKKELALKRAYAANSGGAVTGLYSASGSSESGSPMHLDANNNNNNLRFGSSNEAAFQYLSSGGSTSNNFNAVRSKEVLLSPDNVIASVV